MGKISFGMGQNFVGVGQNIFRHEPKLFWCGLNCTRSKSEGGPIFYSCLESSLKVDCLKIAWKLEGLSQNCKKILKTFIKQNLLLCIAFL